MAMTPDQARWFADTFASVVRNIERAVMGKTEAVRLAVTCMLAEGHLLLEDYPGTGKTTLARAMAQTVQGTHSRIQFTPDLLPSDVTGVTIYDQKSGVFEFYRGPVFASIVLADEINRASPKTQAPRRMASTASLIPPKAVITTTAVEPGHTKFATKVQPPPSSVMSQTMSRVTPLTVTLYTPSGALGRAARISAQELAEQAASSPSTAASSSATPSQSSSSPSQVSVAAGLTVASLSSQSVLVVTAPEGCSQARTAPAAPP